MNLSDYDGKYVRVKNIYGDTFSGLAEYGNCDFLECEYGGNEDGIFIENFLVYNSQIKSIEEIEVHGRNVDGTDDPAQILSERCGTALPAAGDRSGDV